MRRVTPTTILLCNHMLQILCNFNPHKLYIKQVRSLFFHFSIYPTKRHFFTTTSFADPSLSSTPSRSSSSSSERNKTSLDLSSIDYSGIAQAVILRCSHFSDKKGKSYANASLKDLLLDISDVIPEITRRFRRFLELKPEDVLQILLGFQFECEKFEIQASKVEALWGIFKWASEQNKGFKHLPRSCDAMASMLIQVGMLREVEFLLSTMESQGVSLDSHEIFSNLIKGYVGASELEGAVLVFDQMRGRGLVPSLSSCCVLIDLLVRRRKTQMAYRVCADMVEMNINLRDMEKTAFDNVIRLLCGDGKIQEARTLVKKFMILGVEPSNLVLNEIACGYCEKKDFEDLLSFFVETKSGPDVVVSNKIIYTLCSSFGAERAYFFLQELEHLGFRPDEITFGVLIGWSCRERNLRSAFVYFSEILSRGLKPDIYSYNALIGGVFKEGMWKHARDLLDEMVDSGTTPDISTFRILLAGYCKARQFDEAKMTVCEMVNRGFIDLSSLENPLSKAFMVLELNSFPVKLKRDNDVGFSKTEFFDNLGNGLYLDTNINEYEKRVTEVLEDSMLPDFDLLVTKECGHGNFRTALLLVNEMVRRGQELSLPVFSELVKGLCASGSHIKASISLLEKMPKLANQLDQKTLNLLVQAYCKKGLTYEGRITFDGMLLRDLTIEKETYTALIMGLCKKGHLRDLCGCWDIARNNKWLPALEDCKILVECLCKRKMLKDALELLESMLVSFPHIRLEVCHLFLEKLCVTGFTSIAYVLAEELLRQGCVSNHLAYSHHIRGLCKEKKFSAAFKILETMLAKNLAPCLDVSELLIPQLYRADRSEKAVALGEISLRGQSTFSLPVHNALLEGFCATGKVGEAADLFLDMLSNCLLQDDDIYNMLIQGHCQANNLRKVEELLGVMIRKNLSLSISSYRTLVRLMCMKGRVLCALSLKELMIGQCNYPDLMIYNILVFYLLSAGNSLLANKVLNELQRKGLLLDEVTYNFVVYGFSRCKDVSSSVQYLSTMISKELRPRNRSLRTVISCLCDTGELRKALELSREMELRGWIHGSIVQNAIVEGLLSHGKLQEAEHFLDRMVDKNLIPDTINYNNLIKQFCLYGRPNKAVDLLNIMLKKGNVPNSTSYDYVISGFCACNKLDQAMEFHIEMLDRDLKPSINTWDMLIHKFCQGGRTSEAERLLISALQLGETPTRKMYSSVIDRYRFENNLRKSSEIMQAMQRSGHDPDFDTHWSLISNLSNSNDKDNKASNQGFLSRLLSGSGFAWKADSKAKLG